MRIRAASVVNLRWPYLDLFITMDLWPIWLGVYECRWPMQAIAYFYNFEANSLSQKLIVFAVWRIYLKSYILLIHHLIVVIDVNNVTVLTTKLT